MEQTAQRVIARTGHPYPGGGQNLERRPPIRPVVSKLCTNDNCLKLQQLLSNKATYARLDSIKPLATYLLQTKALRPDVMVLNDSQHSR